MGYIIIGTAGHVDHGKTELIRAITGTNTDRLIEEKERGISIELGFAYLELPGGKKAGIVDVPGHERFIKNMLAGVGGIDLALLVIAADEGIMPQTKEHMDILSILGVKTAVVAVTKIDLVDSEWLDMIKEEVNDFLKDTPLDGAPVCFVSSVEKKGLSNLLDRLAEAVEMLPKGTVTGPPRLPVDRVFTMAGFGTIVTGTLVSGELSMGENVEINPGEIPARIRSLQVHGKDKDTVRAPSRVAVNLSGVVVEQIKRGYVVAAPGTFASTRLMDIKMKLLPGTEKPVKNRARIRIHLGTAEVIGRVVLLDRQELKPGEEAYAQLLLEKDIVGAKGDKLVIRSYSPLHTIGGGMVINPQAKRHKRFNSEVLKNLYTLEKGVPAEILGMQLKIFNRAVDVGQLYEQTGIPESEIKPTLYKLAQNGGVKILKLENRDYYIHAEVYHGQLSIVLDSLEGYLREYPLRSGIPKEELRSRHFPYYNLRIYQALLKEWEREGKIQVDAQTVGPANYSVSLSSHDRDIVERIKKLTLEGAFQPPSWKTITQELNLQRDQEYLLYLIRQGDIIKISEDIYFHKDNLEKAKKLVNDYLRENDRITIGETRNLLNTSRKYILPILEYLDKIGITERIGDARKLKQRGRP